MILATCIGVSRYNRSFGHKTRPLYAPASELAALYRGVRESFLSAETSARKRRQRVRTILIPRNSQQQEEISVDRRREENGKSRRSLQIILRSILATKFIFGKKIFT